MKLFSRDATPNSGLSVPRMRSRLLSAYKSDCMCNKVHANQATTPSNSHTARGLGICAIKRSKLVSLASGGGVGRRSCKPNHVGEHATQSRADHTSVLTTEGRSSRSFIMLPKLPSDSGSSIIGLEAGVGATGTGGIGSTN